VKRLNRKPAKIGIAGLGTVGSSTARILLSKPQNATLTAVSARTKGKDRGFSEEGLVWYDDPIELAKDPDIDIFAELIGGDEGPALESVKIALANGKHVVTANKALLAKHGMALAKLAEENGVALRFEAAIAGGIPIVKALREGLKANTITRVIGILNGTCNYMLTRMGDEGMAFDECLKIAQDLGYAEADPTFDIGGFDTAHKLSLLSSLAFGHETAAESVLVEGIEAITSDDIKTAKNLGYKIKLLGIARQTENGIEQRVHPTLIPENSAIARVDGVLNAVGVEGDAVGSVMLVGPGAGGDATASAVVGDIFDITYGDETPVYGFAQQEMTPYEAAKAVSHEGGFYISISVKDETGVFAAIAQEMAEKNISLKSIMQNKNDNTVVNNDSGLQKIVLITHNCIESTLTEAISNLSKHAFIVGNPQVIRIENLS